MCTCKFTTSSYPYIHECKFLSILVHVHHTPHLIFKTGSTLGRELFVLFRRFFILVLTTAPTRHDGPGGHPRTPSRPSDAGRGHQSHPQGSRRPEDNHTEMASLACGTAAGDPHKSPPANPAGHSVPRVCVAGGNGPEAPG